MRSATLAPTTHSHPTCVARLQMKRAPKKYGLEVRGGDSSLEAQLKETLVLQNVRKLADHGLVSGALVHLATRSDLHCHALGVSLHGSLSAM